MRETKRDNEQYQNRCQKEEELDKVQDHFTAIDQTQPF